MGYTMSDSYHNARLGGISDGTAAGERGASDYRIHKRQLAAQNEMHQADLGRQMEAGREVGDGLMKIIAGLFIHPKFSLVGFWLISTGFFVWFVNVFGVNLLVGLGLDKNNPPTWLIVSIYGIPVILTVLLRKIIPRMMKWVFYLAIGGITLAFVGGIIWAIIERTASS